MRSCFKAAPRCCCRDNEPRRVLARTRARRCGAREDADAEERQVDREGPEEDGRDEEEASHRR